MDYKKFLLERIKTTQEWIDADKESVDYAKQNLKWAKGHLVITKNALMVDEGRLEKVMTQFKEDFPELDITEELALLTATLPAESLPDVPLENGVYSNNPDNDQRDWS